MQDVDVTNHGLVVRHTLPSATTTQQGLVGHLLAETSSPPHMHTSVSQPAVTNSGSTLPSDPRDTGVIVDGGLPHIISRESGSESPKSWHSLPLQEEGEMGEVDDRTHGDLQQQLPLTEISTRVEQLTQLVERMSARFVILENQLKLVESQKSAKQGNKHEVAQLMAGQQYHFNSRMSNIY